MKSTEGEVTKTKTAIKAKAKKSKGSAKKPARKKTAKKKTADTKKISTRKKRIADDDQPIATRKRRSDRNRNTSFNYEESSNESNATPSDEEISWRGRRKEKVAKRGGRRTKDSSNNSTIEENWMIYDLGNVESDESWNEHYHRLQEFHSTHGHSGVPTDMLWSEEPDFADWVSRQRQLFREIRTGYRIASQREERRWRRLQVLRFPLNYEKWLWQRKYSELCDALNGKKYTADTNLPSSLRDWVDRQKSLVESGTHGRMDSERRSSLEKLGVLARETVSDFESDDGEDSLE